MLYPVFLDLRGALTLVVGGGNVGLRKARGLLEAGARVRAVSPEFAPEWNDLPTQHLERRARPFELQDLEGVRLAFACTDRDDVNGQVAAAARHNNVFCNHASDPEGGDLRLGATHRQGALTAAFSSGLELPLLAQALRDRFAATLPQGLERKLETWQARRAAALRLPAAERTAALENLRRELRAELNS
ncbi:precorrin-2 dehydrogenase/sirohydrochlorin ferrochelatase [Deinobacterium chartae]|uniref:precorrin-2 dehydrogenase n=1 Tax=Deinobacterium chartae TaxID=521158 RepID=A0A841I4T0_9DEIO|nr:bifunctional precorrin-2 dehydrogenase/sirohydrochlorin ferrochelatase [Deinobacterium chartae]MBB6099430.1 precorrin-2 dehydrogenase/sirohydrochlorin ferrochelatase [Deinobacterium chartae]